MTPRQLLLHYLDKHRTDPDPEKWHAAIMALFDEREADAERYQYLRNRVPDDVTWGHGPEAGCWIDAEDGHDCLILLTGDDADAAIDAARAAGVTT